MTKKFGWVTLWAIFPQAHLVTLPLTPTPHTHKKAVFIAIAHKKCHISIL
jgi:hypothetical protein